MVNEVSYNIVIERLKAFASGHLLIKQFTHGDPANIFPNLEESDYPLMHVTPTQVAWATGERSYSFTIIFADIPRDKETAAEYQREIVSDCLRLAEDLLAEVKNGGVIFGEDVTLDTGASATPFMAEYTHTLTGIQLTIGLTFPYKWSACDIPANWAPGGSGSGGSGGGFGLVLKVNSVNNVLQNLLNIVDGTNTTVTDLGDGRVRIDAVGGTAAAWGSISGTLSNQVDLQNALDLKADISSLAAVAFSGDYNDLINTPGAPSLQDVTDVGNSTTNNIELGPSASIILDNGAKMGEGTTDAGLGGLGGIALKCSIDYELKWDAGRLFILEQDGFTIREVRNNFAFAPTANDDASKGFVVGSKWVLDNGVIYNCSDASNGAAVWAIQPIGALTDLSDVTITTPLGYNILRYNSFTNQWINDSINNLAGKIKLDNLDDVDATSPINGQVLAWNNLTQTWEPRTLTTGVTSVGLSMPPAFTVTGSPVTGSGTLTATANGTSAQLIDGTGNLQTIPTGLPPTGSAGGDLSGNYPNPNVHRIHGVDMQSGTPSTDEVWIYGGSPAKWQHQHIGADSVVNTSGVMGASVKDALANLDSDKQDSLVSGTNIKTVNSNSLLGSGNVSVGTVTSVGGTGIVAGLSLSGTVTGIGSLTLGGTLSTPVSTINDSTTIGQSLVTLANPSAIRYIRINANNTAAAIDAATLRSELGLPSGTLVRLLKTADQSITASTATPSDITDLTFTITAGKKYKFRATIIHSTTALASIRLGINANVSVNSVYQQAFLSLSVSGSPGIVTYTWNTLGVITNSQAGLTSLVMSVVDGILDAGTTGTAAMQFSKVQVTGGTLLIKAGSILEYSEY